MSGCEPKPWEYFRRSVGGGVWQATRPIQNFGGLVGKVVFAGPVVFYELSEDGPPKARIGESVPVPLAEVAEVLAEDAQILELFTLAALREAIRDGG